LFRFFLTQISYSAEMHFSNRILIVFSVLLMALQASATQQKLLSLNFYLKQVKENHLGYQAAVLQKEGSALRLSEASLALAPTLFSTLQQSSDSKKSPFFPYDKIISNTYSLGISQTTRFGLQAKLSYLLYFTDYVGINQNYYEGKPVLELSQSLWRNHWGAEIKAIEKAQKAAVLATHFGESFKMKQLLLEAETIYWKFQYTKKNIEIQKSALERAQKIYDWSNKRVRLRLTDQADLLQAKAVLESRKLQCELALNEERATAIHFNQARGVKEMHVPETLEEIPIDPLMALTPIKNSILREDLKAAAAIEEAATANAELMSEHNKPVLEVFTSLALNGKNSTARSATLDAFKTNQPSTLIGLRLQLPLYFGTLQDARNGWLKELKSAELLYQQKQFEQEQEWTELTLTFEEAKKRYLLAQAIESAQSQKLFYEKDRLNRGRSTTYQVLLFEQDFAQSQITRLQIQTEILQIHARLKLFSEPGGSNESP
jgi:outer membrane protein TolC